MRNIGLITKREYLTRVRKRSFLVMTLLSPLLMISFYGIIFYFSLNKDIDDTVKRVVIIDHSGVYENNLKSNKSTEFVYLTFSEKQAREWLVLDNCEAYVYIADTNANNINLQLVSKEQPSLSTIDYIQGQLQTALINHQLRLQGIDKKILDQVNETKIHLKTFKITEKGIENGNSGVATLIGLMTAVLIYMFVLLYGVQVMKGVIEEKTSRIVEVIISSVEPFDLMMGKILGIALVGLTQFVIWVVLVTLLSGPVSGVILEMMHVNPAELAKSAAGHTANGSSQVGNFMSAIGNLDFPLIVGMFLFYFVGGYLFYAALFAAVGSAVDNETDTQQFMLPITLPLVFALVLAQAVLLSAPNGDLAFWLSIIPFTSPIVMMVRLPFGVPAWQICLSALILIAGFISTVWFAGRIYRTGILMYGKKASYKEIWKWFTVSK